MLIYYDRATTSGMQTIANWQEREKSRPLLTGRKETQYKYSNSVLLCGGYVDFFAVQSGSPIQHGREDSASRTKCIFQIGTHTVDHEPSKFCLVLL